MFFKIHTHVYILDMYIHKNQLHNISKADMLVKKIILIPNVQTNYKINEINHEQV